MPVIEIHTVIDAPADRCFMLSLSVDVHTESVATTHERAIAGVTSGTMKLHDTVTWQARHFGLNLTMTSQIAAYDRPRYFVSQMVKGPFRRLYHQHFFREQDGKTIMTDLFELQAPLGFLGKVAEKCFLVAYMKKFLLMRNAYIKALAESPEHITRL
jgi:ligand-binding SRPBCC domain-containing protein